MHPTICLNERIEILKSLEEYGYSIAYYLLMNEESAIEATKAALLEVSREPSFFVDTSIVQQMHLKQVIMKEVLHVKRCTLTG